MPLPKDDPRYLRRRAAENALLSEITRAARRIADARDDRGEAVSRTDNVWRVLTAVATSRGCPTIADLGRAMGCSRQAAHKLVYAAERAGVIRLEPNPDDRRILQAFVTPSGRSQLAAADATRSAWIHPLLMDLRDGDMATTTHVVRVIRQRLERAARDLAARERAARELAQRNTSAW